MNIIGLVVGMSGQRLHILEDYLCCYVDFILYMITKSKITVMSY